MKTLNRPMMMNDLKDKGLPFECCNCGNKPTAEQVVANHGDCEICGDTIKVDCVVTAEYVLRHNADVDATADEKTQPKEKDV